MFCPYCGKKLEDGTFCDCPEAQEELALEAEAAPSEEQINQDEPMDRSSEIVGTFFNNAKGFLDTGSKKAKEVAEFGIKKAKQAATTGKEKLDNVYQASKTADSTVTSSQTPQIGTSWSSAAQDIPQQDSSWDNPVNQAEGTVVTIEQYPFFKSENERTIAAIGERFAAADQEGTYQKPYAILTQEKLYCRNEAGYFIKDTSEIERLSVEYQAENYRKLSILLEIFGIIVLFSSINGIIFGLFMGACFGALFYLPITVEKKAKIKLHQHTTITFDVGVCVIGTCIAFFYSKFACVVFLLVGIASIKAMQKYFKSIKIFSLSCTGGTFSFIMNDYSQQEINNFIEKATPLCMKGKYASYKVNTLQKPAGNGKFGVIAVCVVLVFAILIGGVWYFETHCKVFGCGRESVINGYCGYHYAEKKASAAYGAAEDFLGGLFGG